MFCDIKHLSDGSPFEGDPRHVLQAQPRRAPASKGFTFYAAPEMEFFYLRVGRRRRPCRSTHAGFFDLTQLDMVSDLRRQTILTLEAMGIPVEYSFHEDGPSQHEIDLRYTDALTMADNVMTFRLVVQAGRHRARRVRHVHAQAASRARSGSGMHTHLSLFEGDVNAFHDPGDEYGLSKVGKCFIAGLLHHAREITAVTNQTGQLLQAADRGLRGAGARLLGPQQRVGARAACRRRRRARRARPASSSARPTRRATRTSRSR